MLRVAPQDDGRVRGSLSTSLCVMTPEKKSRAESPALKIVSTLFSPKFGFDLD
jgi:hypothetical protein